MLHGKQVSRWESSNKKWLRARMRAAWNERYNRRRFAGDSEWSIKNTKTGEIEAL